MRKMLFLLLITVSLSCAVFSQTPKEVVRVETGNATGQPGQVISIPVQVYNLPHEIGALTLIADFDPPAVSVFGDIDSERWPGIVERFSDGIYRAGWYYMPNRGYPNQVYFSGEGLLTLDVVVNQNTKINLFAEFADRNGNVIPCQIKTGRIDVGVPYVPLPAWKCGDPITTGGSTYSTTYLKAQKACVMTTDLQDNRYDLVINGQHTGLYTSEQAAKACPEGWAIATNKMLKALPLLHAKPGYYLSYKKDPPTWQERNETSLWWTSMMHRDGRYYFDVKRPSNYFYEASWPYAARLRCVKSM